MGDIAVTAWDVEVHLCIKQPEQELQRGKVTDAAASSHAAWQHKCPHPVLHP